MYKIKSFAKINLGLEVLSKRNDNFHSIKTVISKISLFDEIQIEKSDFNSVKQLGIKEDENLVTKILLHMQKKYFTEKISIRIKKNIPYSSGLGGGSSNAAVTLKLLSKLWNVPLPPINELVLLGADIPVCMNWRLQRMQGIGEKNSFVVSPDSLWIVLLNNGDRVPTSTVFQSVTQNEFSGLVNVPRLNEKNILIKFLKSTRNDLEKSAIKNYPSINDLINSLNLTSGCLVARMSGSGSTCFGLYEKKDEAEKAKKHLLNKFPNAWIKVAKIFS